MRYSNVPQGQNFMADSPSSLEVVSSDSAPVCFHRETFWRRSRIACAAGLLQLLLLLTLPATMHAQFNYTTNAGEITITKYTGVGGTVIIPGTINGLPVVGIGNAAFEFSSLTNITIPNSVASIGYGAFLGCTGLTNFLISSSVTNIGEAALFGCTSMTAITVDALNPAYSSSADKVLFNKNQTVLIQYPGGKAGSYTVPNITSIGSVAFAGGTGLTSVTIPNSVTNIEHAAFFGCSSLTAINVAVLNPAYSSVDAVLFDKTRTMLVQYPGGKAGSYSISNSVTRIESAAFAGCTSLTGITIPNSVTNIGGNAFGGCTSLTNIAIPDSVTSIGDLAFSDCNSLTAISVAVLNPAYSSSVDAVLFNKGQTALIQYPGGKAGSYVVPDSVTRVEDFAFLSCLNLTSITIPNSVTSIGYGAFSHCSSLTNATISIGLTSIADWVFQYCTSLTSITIPNSVTSIGASAFAGCSSLSSVTIGNGVTNVSDYAFYYCTSLTGIFFYGNAPVVSSSAFTGADNAAVYYLSGTTGWGPMFGGRPTAQWTPGNPPLAIYNDGTVGVRTNRFGFTISGADGMVVVVEASTNLTNPIWSPVQTNTLAGDSYYFSDPSWTNHPSQFYRLRSP